MHAAEIVVSEMQRDGGFQVHKFLAESIRQTREAADRHAHREILPFYKASRDVVRIRIARADLGYNLRDPWWGVPRIGALSEVPEQFHKLREIYIRSKTFGNAHGVMV